MPTDTPKGQPPKNGHAGPLKSNGLTFDEMVKKAVKTPPPPPKQSQTPKLASRIP